MSKKIQSALISVYYKDGLEPIVEELKKQGVTIYSTGGTQKFIENLGAEVIPVESITGFPSILDGRVKTLHPGVFGGILARREDDHLNQLKAYNLPEIDLVIVDLYPFEETLANTTDESSIIEKIDIGGISLIRAAAKNFNDVAVVASRDDYGFLLNMLQEKDGATDKSDRKALARKAFNVSSHYDVAIFNYFSKDVEEDAKFKQSIQSSEALRYGENPHQSARFYGNLEEMFDKLCGKALSYNNLVDVDAAVGIMNEFKDDAPTFVVLKHTNACGVATRPTVLEAWNDALAGDPVSAFGGILICNSEIDAATAKEIHKLFFEVLIAPSFTEEAYAILTHKRKKRVLMNIKNWSIQSKTFKTLLNGVIEQDADSTMEGKADFRVATEKAPTAQEIKDLEFANKCCKHLKSNTIVLAKNGQLLGMGCGQTSRVDALRQAITKAEAFGFDLEGSAMASDAFFPFDDCVTIAAEAGIKTVTQPGGSIKDQDSINACNKLGLSMVMTGVRHFRH
ncbi:MAG: phosphoribosylaminoimidazolecarboxamide formyltransferase/IMP cyclohydrolase [Cognaticolwellia sp.]|jgi:phosphoribosylaminoimidazolecarboxamide formyltransferase/IMP cyclohydrolase